jgi:hypothetical protein
MLHSLTITLAALGLSFRIAAAESTPPATILEIDVENLVFYYLDVADPSKLATSASAVPRLAGVQTFKQQVALADIVAVNGKPAKGVWVGRNMPLLFAVQSVPGQAIADLGGFGPGEWHMAFLQPDGTPIGSLMFLGIGGMAAPPGAPIGAAVHNLTIAGGTGAFLGARGQLANKSAGPSRAASAAEDPANRRINGGGSRRDIVHLIPMTWPEVLSLPTGPAIYHDDLSPVTAERPARAGETLIMSVAGLGPVRPRIDPGQPFPPYQEGNLHEVNSPVEVTVNGGEAQVINKIGWPTMNNVYRVDFRVPEGAVAGMASIAVTVAWIKGPEVKIPIR